MEQRKFEFVLRAEQPIAHHAESFGNQAISMRRKVRQEDGSWANVPVVTGDSMRHGLREASAYAFLDAAGLLGNANLTESALRLLFSGGQITGPASGSLKLSEHRQLASIMPTLDLLGGCAQNRMVPGRLWVDDATLICKETRHVLPEWAFDGNGEADTCRAHVEIVQRVRMDPTLDPGKRMLLSAEAGEKAQQRLLKSEQASELDDAKGKDGAKSTMLPRTFERVAQGSLFHWSVTATCYSDLDADTFTVMCASFLADARVGGKRGTGHGLLKPILGRNVLLSRPSERAETIKPDQLSTGKVGELFRAHVKENAAAIAEYLSKVAA